MDDRACSAGTEMVTKPLTDMLKKIANWFVIKSRVEALVVIYALALGAVTRGEQYLQHYPGFAGYLLFAACTGAVFMAGAKILEVTRPKDRRRMAMIARRAHAQALA